MGAPFVVILVAKLEESYSETDYFMGGSPE